MDKTMRPFQAFTVPVVAVVLGLVVGAVLMLILGYNPFNGYVAMFQGIFGSLYNIGETLRMVTPLIFTGLAVAFAFRTGLFNIGVEGQFMIGQLAALYVGIMWKLPTGIHAAVALLAAMIAGGLWAAIAGFLKARMRIHEVITTIMLNYIALYTSNYVISHFLKSETERSKDILPTASLKAPLLSVMFDNARIHWGILISLLFAVIAYWLLFKTVLGYELRAVGFNPHAAEYAGMNVSRNIVLSMAISGMIAAAGGACETLGVYGYMSIAAGFSGIGFDGIAVALIGANNPFGVILSALLFGGLTYGSNNMQMVENIPTEIIRVVMALIIFFVAAGGFVKWLLGVFRRRQEVQK
ncbi:ABC transporter permease [Collibacillus ludicampi]|jgi:ABC-type uncharacterized transport system permease subunit|uniref:ABC transporter permease n=1 Tax=Collibacillus ludicampi TaxID=2771369 RepID=A0AAV4LJ15_9BACL|nr:ABC transporter permease [Collibacillus ludicampi]GIM47867.1 ABC transporter permease [Collibacillus ludicampi]